MRIRAELEPLIAEAGRSAIRWRDQEYMDYLDPGRRRRTAATVAKTVLTVVTVLVAVFAAASNGVLLVSLPPAVLLLLTRVEMPVLKAAAWTLLGLLVIWPVMDRWQTVAVGLAIAVAVLLIPARSRLVLSTSVALAAAAVLVMHRTAADALVLNGWLAATVLAQCILVTICWAPHHLMALTRRGRLTAADIQSSTPVPVPTVPWHVRVFNGRAKGQPPAAIMKKAAGAYGERRTALLLLGLSRGRGTRVFHDVAVPGSDANVDHLVLGAGRVVVVDSKQFGTAGEPGVVTRSETGEPIFRDSTGIRPLGSTVNTAVWAARQIGERFPGQALQVVFAIHNASVAPALEFHVNGVLVRFMPAYALVSYITGQLDDPGDVPSRGRVQLLAAGGAPGHRFARPMKLLGSARGTEQAMVRLAGELRGAAAPQQFAAGEPGDVGLDSGFVTSPDQAYVSPLEMVDAVLGSRWEMMIESSPVPLDDVPPDLRGVRRGSRLLITDFSDTAGPTSIPAIAVTGPCQGRPGKVYIWFASPEAWRVYEQTGRPVAISTISVEHVTVLEEQHG